MRHARLTGLTVLSLAAAVLPARAGLVECVKEPEPAFAWQLKGKIAHPLGGTVYDLKLVSQTWQGITWEHQLQVYQPAGVKPNRTMLLWNTGGESKPNAGHNLRQTDAAGRQDVSRAINGLCAFVRCQIDGRPLPKLAWKHDEADGKLRLTVDATAAPKAARLWAAEAPTRDFRKAEWRERPATLTNGKVVGLVEPPAKGCLASFAELGYDLDGLRYNLSTQLRVAGTPPRQASPEK